MDDTSRPGISIAISHHGHGRRHQRIVGRRSRLKSASAILVDADDINIYRQLAGGVTAASAAWLGQPRSVPKPGDQASLGVAWEEMKFTTAPRVSIRPR